MIQQKNPDHNLRNRGRIKTLGSRIGLIRLDVSIDSPDLSCRSICNYVIVKHSKPRKMMRNLHRRTATEINEIDERYINIIRDIYSNSKLNVKVCRDLRAFIDASRTPIIGKNIDSVEFVATDIISNMDELCRAYISMISQIDVVKRACIKRDGDELFLWTVIDAVPFDSAVTEPIYRAIATLYERISEKLLLDFDIINLAELRDKSELEKIIPQKALAIYPQLINA